MMQIMKMNKNTRSELKKKKKANYKQAWTILLAEFIVQYMHTFG